jgi:hypothetical protein
MSTIRQLHDKAIGLAQLALVARQKGEFEKAENLARQAYEYESQAANLIPSDESSEPTRSIMYSSAASLAFQCKKFEESLQLIAKGLSGFPPSQVKEELKTLWEQVNFEAHLQVRGVVLSPEELQLSLQGNVVGPGIIPYDEFLRRIEAMYSILSRTVQRKMKRGYQRTGRLAGMYRYFTPALSVPRAGSFAITFRLALPSEHQKMMFVDTTEIIDEILTGTEFINKGDEERLKELIREEAYYLNFVSLVRKMAPDGDNINLVGLTSNKRQVGLTRQYKDISLVSPVEVSAETRFQHIELKGVLNYAKARKEDILGLTTEDNRNLYVHVREGMDDLVRSYFDQKVSVTGAYDIRYKRIYLEDIQPVED